MINANHFNKSFRLKTQKAIAAINLYQNFHSEIARLSLLLNPSPLPLPSQHPKSLEEGRWNKLQFLPNEMKFFTLAITSFEDSYKHNLRLIFKDFSGKELNFNVSTRPEPITLSECNLRVGGQKIMRVAIPEMTGRGLFATFYSKDLTFIKFKFETTSQHQTQEVSGRSLSTSRENILQSPNILRKSLYLEPKTQRSQQSLHFRQRSPILEGKASPRSPRLPKVESTRLVRLQSVEQEKLRLHQAQNKRAELDVLNEKQRELREVSKKCIGLLEQYQQYCKSHKKITKMTHHSATIFILASKFVINAHACSQEGANMLSHAARLRSKVKQVGARFMQIAQEVRRIQPQQIVRDMNTVGCLVGLQARSLLAISKKTAGNMLIDCFKRVAVGVLINKSLNKATNYRKQVRIIQVYWRRRNKAQIACFQEYINQQLEDLIKKHPHFSSLLSTFYSGEVGIQLSWQYLRDSTVKMKSVFGSFKEHLIEIQQMKKANLMIKSYNRSALRKNQKQELVIPKVPPYPVFRYFRDITIIKAMIRSWLEIEHRKQMKNTQNAKRLKQESPQRQKKLNQKSKN